MRVSPGGPLLAALLAVSSTAHAGFLDRLTGAGQPKAATQIHLAADPSPPAEPSLDAFGGSAPGRAHVHNEPVQAGAPSIAVGQPAVKTAPAVPVNTAGQQQQQETPPYEGTEYRWKMFRFRPAEMMTEAYLLGGVLFFIGISFAGRKFNEDQAIAWNKAHIPTLTENFASYTAVPQSVSLTRVNPATYVGHASGRRGTSGFAVKVSTVPRHDLFTLALEAGWKIYDLTYASSSGTVTLDFELDTPLSSGTTSNAPKAANKEDFVWALVNKHVMQQTREERFDLQAFTSVSEPQILQEAAGNDEWATFTEANTLNDFFLKKPNVGIVELLRDEKQAAKYLRSIIISDIVKERPDESILESAGAIPKSRRLTVVFELPSASRANETVPILQVALNLIDVLAGSSLPNELLKKTQKRRAEVYSLLLQESRKEAKEKASTSARAIKLRSEQEKLEKMTPAERRKYELKQKDKEMRNMAKKQQKR